VQHRRQLARFRQCKPPAEAPASVKTKVVKPNLGWSCECLIRDAAQDGLLTMESFATVSKVFQSSTLDRNLPIIYLARHGETAWTITGQHTGLTDLPLTARGERNARALADRLKRIAFTKVFTSPLQRTRRTCELAGFGGVAEIDRELVEWNYGAYEGRRSAEIRAERPDWQLFRDGCPGGESPAQVSQRADNVLTRIRNVKGGDILVFSSGHFIRVLAGRWIGLEPSVHAMSFLLSTASLSAVGYGVEFSQPVIRLWNDTQHVCTE
jgi:broad specificity phosphatase PhoE